MNVTCGWWPFSISLPTDILPMGIAFLTGATIGALFAISFRKHKTLKWWPFPIALLLLAIVIFIIPEYFENLATFALVAITFVYVIFTRQQVEASTKMISEVREQRLAASQPIVIVKCVYSEVVKAEMGRPIKQKLYDHFAVLNTGNGPAIEMEVVLLDEDKNNREAHRETYLKSGEEYEFKPEMICSKAGKHYIVCQFKRIDSITGKESLDQTWLPIEVSMNKESKVVNIVAGELDFKFDVKRKDGIQAFTSKPE